MVILIFSDPPPIGVDGTLPDSLDLVRPLFATSRRDDIDFLRVSETKMFQCPNLVIMTIASTGMYRSLINLGTTDV